MSIFDTGPAKINTVLDDRSRLTLVSYRGGDNA